MSKKAHWEETFFDQMYADMFLTWSDHDANMVAEKIMGLSHLLRGGAAFDQCCGTGGLMAAMMRRGVTAVGCDAAEEYVKRARKSVGSDQVVTCGDAAAWRPRDPVDVAYCWHSSLGYRTRSHANKQLEQLRCSVKGGGHWMLELPHAAWLRRNAAPVWRMTVIHPELGEITVVRHTVIKNRCVIQQWVWHHQGRVIRTDPATRMHLWAPSELKTWAKKRGDSLVAQRDGQAGAWHRRASRMILVFQKRKAR